MSARVRALALCLFVFSTAAVACAHAGPDTCGGYSVERQWDQHFRVTVTARVTEPPRWKLDADGNPSPASFGGEGVAEARTLYERAARQRCIDLGFRDKSDDDDLEWPAQKQVISVSTCADPGAPGKRYYAIRMWGDRLRCGYVHYGVIRRAAQVLMISSVESPR